MLENILPVQLFEVVQDQLIVSGMGQPVAVVIQAIQSAIDWCPDAVSFDHDARWELMRRVQLVCRTVLSLRNDEQAKKRKQQNAEGETQKPRVKRGKGSNEYSDDH